MLGATYEEKNELPYFPVVEALRTAIGRFDQHAHLLPTEFSAAIPELSVMPKKPEAAEAPAQGYLFAGVLRFLKALAGESALVIILEDLHLADEGTLRLFQYLAHNAAEAPFLLVCTSRTGQTEAGITSTLTSLKRAHRVNVTTLAQLSEKQHQELLGQCLPEGEIRRHSTAGCPVEARRAEAW